MHDAFKRLLENLPLYAINLTSFFQALRRKVVDKAIKKARKALKLPHRFHLKHQPELLRTLARTLKSPNTTARGFIDADPKVRAEYSKAILMTVIGDIYHAADIIVLFRRHHKLIDKWISALQGDGDRWEGLRRRPLKHRHAKRTSARELEIGKFLMPSG